MTEAFEENLGKHTYITLPQVKDYLSISSNTYDARISNIISYSTSVIEHYIGQEVLANNYVEIFDGGVTSVFVNRLPLTAVYQISEFDGSDYKILADPNTYGTPIKSASSSTPMLFHNNAKNTTKVKKFGKSSLSLGTNDYIYSNEISQELYLEQSDFTIEAFIRVDSSILSNASVFSIKQDASNYLDFKTANQYGLSFQAVIEGTSTEILGANTDIESQQFQKRKWAHIAVSRDLENERLYLHYNGTEIANAEYAVESHDFSDSLIIGETFSGYMDEVRVSNICRYKSSFTAPTHRFRPDRDTVFLLHFDEEHNSTEAIDVHAAPSDFNFAIDTGEVTRDIGGQGVRGSYPTTRNSYPALTLSGPGSFLPFPSGVEVSYRAGYEEGSVPLDLQLATLDYIKLVYKQDQEKKGFSFEGERGDSFPLAGNFPPHIRRILDLYRIID
jgi:hypothetical protein